MKPITVSFHRSLSKNARIRSIQYYRATSPLRNPIADSTHSIDSIAFVVTRIELESGVTGESSLLAFQYSPQTIVGALRDIGPLAQNFEAWETGRFAEQALAESECFGNVGISRWAAAAINIAMWDAWSRTLDQPMWKIFGAYRSEVPVYGSGGWLSYSMEDLIDEVSSHVKRGFRAVKIKVGSPELERDLERLARVREAIGPRVKIMIDANQGLNLSSAVKLARCARDFDIDWFEEPIAHNNFDGYEHLRRHGGISLAMGEREYDTSSLRELIRRNAIDLWQPDILRLGGVEGWRSSALLANEYRLPVLPHYYKEYDVPLLCTIPNAYGSESFDWIDCLVDHPIPIQDGMARPLEGAGWGFRFKDSCLTEID